MHAFMPTDLIMVIVLKLIKPNWSLRETFTSIGGQKWNYSLGGLRDCRFKLFISHSRSDHVLSTWGYSFSEKILSGCAESWEIKTELVPRCTSQHFETPVFLNSPYSNFGRYYIRTRSGRTKIQFQTSNSTLNKPQLESNSSLSCSVSKLAMFTTSNPRAKWSIELSGKDNDGFHVAIWLIWKCQHSVG